MDGQGEGRLVFGQPQRRDFAQGLRRPGKAGAEFRRGGRPDDADVAIEKFEVVIVADHHYRPAGVIRSPGLDQSGFRQNFLDQAVQILHAVGAAAQGAKDAEFSKGRQGGGGIRGLEIFLVAGQDQGLQGRLEPDGRRQGFPNHLRGG